MTKINIVSPTEIKRIVNAELLKNNSYYNKVITKLRERIIELEKRIKTSKIKLSNKNIY
jgi:hypothetical protein